MKDKNTTLKRPTHYTISPILHILYMSIALGLGFLVYYIKNDAKTGIQVGVISLALVAAGFIKDVLTAHQSKREFNEKEM